MSDIKLFPHVTIIRDNKWFIIKTDNDKYVSLERKTYLTDNVDFATRFDKDVLAEFLHYHINDIIGN